ncbi:hypothetical protein FRB94_001844 [Tulasnella sp. JGI-2019a]|nr:hypothetical protein FRB93_009052 [Tulasnella sp. JGI-2019a]KAG8987465.1 hypothetical protein FRB94_001844 [Tulasnella sp. JGI-2019a]
MGPRYGFGKAKTQDTNNLALIKTSGGTAAVQEMRTGLWLDLDKNIQYAIEKTQTEIYHTPEYFWKDMVSFTANSSRPNAAKLAIDRLTATSVELCRIMRSSASFILQVYNISSEAVELFDCTSTTLTEEELIFDIDNLASRISRQLDFSGCLEEKLQQTIDHLKQIQTETFQHLRLNGGAANKYDSTARVCLRLAKASSALGMTMALCLGGERSAAVSGIPGLSTFDMAIVAGLGIFSASSSLCGSGVKAATAWKKCSEEMYEILRSTLEHMRDTLCITEVYTGNFQLLRMELANTEAMLFDGSELAGITDKFKRLKLVFGELRNEGVLAREFMDHYQMLAGCYTEEGLLEPPCAMPVEVSAASLSLSTLMFKPYPFLCDQKTHV